MANGGWRLKRVLIADDDAETLERFATVARAEGYEVITAGDGQTALDLAQSAPPDLILLDVTLPMFDGLETCELIRNDAAVSESVPILLMSEFEVDSRRVHRVRATACISKQVALAELRELLLKHVGPA